MIFPAIVQNDVLSMTYFLLIPFTDFPFHITSYRCYTWYLTIVRKKNITLCYSILFLSFLFCISTTNYLISFLWKHWHDITIVLKMKIWIYWSKSNSRISTGICKLKLKNLLLRTKFYWSWARGLVLIVRTVVNLVLSMEISSCRTISFMGFFLIFLFIVVFLWWSQKKTKSYSYGNYNIRLVSETSYQN